jgi:2-keto-4-pentenoate hydratase
VIWDAWQAGDRIVALPDALQPSTRVDGYRIQACLEAKSAHPLFGWKIAATSAAGQAHIGVDQPLAGRLLAEMVVPEGSELTLAGNAMRVAEPEFVFRLATDLVPRDDPYDVTEVIAAVASLHLGIEVPDSRFVEFPAAGGPQLIADNACAHRWALGPKAPATWRDLDLSVHPVHCTVGSRYERDGSGGNVLGDPRIGLTWLANELSGLGITMGAGQYVTTGTCTSPLDIQPGETVVADFGSLGSMSLHFTE